MPKAKRIHWSPETWLDVAKRFAHAHVQFSQGGKTPSFSSIFQGAQASLPVNQRRNGSYTSFDHCPDAFKKEVKAEIARLTSVKKVNGEKHGAVNDTTKSSGSIEFIGLANGKDLFSMPKHPILTEEFRKVLMKAGFEFRQIVTAEELEALYLADKRIHWAAHTTIPKT